MGPTTDGDSVSLEGHELRGRRLSLEFAGGCRRCRDGERGGVAVGARIDYVLAHALFDGREAELSGQPEFHVGVSDDGAWDSAPDARRRHETIDRMSKEAQPSPQED